MELLARMRRMAGAFILIALVLTLSAGVRPAPAATTPSHLARQARPIQLGVSGGNIKDMDTLYAYGGTIGALVVDARGKRYILSNNHVMARLNIGVIGEAIIQPSLIDQSYVGYQNTADTVAKLSRFITIQVVGKTRTPTNTVDAALAEVVSSRARSDGSILEIGVPSTSAATAYVGQSVKKSGRSTGLTRGTVAATNVTVDVLYSGARTKSARFIKQIRIDARNFSSGGDSGALIVENKTTAPRPVGLLFAGSGTSTVANPIGLVLSSLGVKMVGKAPASKMEEKAAPDPLDAIGAMKSRYDDNLLSTPGVVGTGVSVDGAGRPVIEIYTLDDKLATRAKIPKMVEGVPTRIVVTGQFWAY